MFDDTTFDNNKEGSKEDEETYKEFKIGKYDAYGYEDFGGYTIYIHLEEVSETTDRYAVIEINAIDWSDDSVEGVEFYEGNKDVKTIVNSVVYNGATGENADSEETEEHEDETDAEEAEENE